MKKKEIIVLGCDHAGFEVKEYIKSLLQKMDYEIEDVGTYSRESVDYPDCNVEKVLKIWLNTRFEGGRHKRRVKKNCKNREKIFSFVKGVNDESEETLHHNCR